MKRRGFTIVELIIVIAIMGILLVLVVVNIRGTQVSARDDERKADVANLALQLEVFYKNGRDDSSTVGRYPSVDLIISGVGSIQSNLRDISLETVKAPGVTDPLQTLVMATNDTQTTAGVAPQPTINQYVYQPIYVDGTALCATGMTNCRKFNIYYRLESDNAVYMVTSKNQ